MRIVRLATMLLLCGCAVPPAASAAPDWVAPQTLHSGEIATASFAIGFDGQGRETRALTEAPSLPPNPIVTRVTLGSHLPGDSLSVESVVNSASAPPVRIPVAANLEVAPNGAAVSCVADLLSPTPPGPQGVRALYRPAGSATWGAPVVVADDLELSSSFTDCEAAIADDGTAAVVATRVIEDSEPRRSEIVARVRPAGGDWTPPLVLSGANREATIPKAAFDAEGNLTVIWKEGWTGENTATVSDDRDTIKMRSRSATNGVFGVTQDPIDGEGNFSINAFVPEFAVGANGSAVVAYQEDDGQTWAAVRNSGDASFGTPQQLVPGSISSAPRGAAVGPDGSMYVAFWTQGISSAESSTGLVRRQAGGTWSAPELVGPPGVNSALGEFGFIGNDAVFVVDNFLGADQLLQAVRWRAGSAQPDAARDLVQPGGPDHQLLDVVDDRQGGLAAVYGMGAGSSEFGGVAYDGSPPILKSLTVPAQATAGQAVGVSAAFADFWSPMGGISWSFGDGGTGSGASASHTWQSAGTYTVTVTGQDTLGNQRTATRQVTVAPPGQGGGQDAAAPKVTLKTPACGKRKGKACKAFRKTRRAWRTLKGTAKDEAGGSGVASVEVGVARKAGKRYEVLKGSKFQKGTTGAKAAKAFVKARLAGSNWTLKMPRSAKPGAYTIRVRATDNAGNVSRVLTKKLKLR